MTRRLLLLAALALLAPATASAQSLFNAAGLGVPADPVDARARALGGVGIGLRGAALMGSDPAAAAFFVLPTVIMTAQPSWVDFERQDNGESGTFRGARFPVMGIAYPTVKSLVATLSLESFLDQRYEAGWPTTLSFGGTPVQVRDEFVSSGGVSQVRIGVARRFGGSLAVGVSASRYSGSLTRRLTRSFGEGVDTTAVESFQDGGFWSYSGLGLTGGASLSLGTVAHLSGSMTWSSPLDATASDDSGGDSRSYDLPLQVRVGASAVLAPGLSLTAGYTSADWSSLDADLGGGFSVGPASSLGVGLELARARLLGRNAPLRFGYRSSDLPFALGAGATETVWTGGLGLHLSQVGEIVRAGVDLAFERGDRKDSILSERFWRGTITVRVSGL
jgi:hypothetical protein